MTVNSDKIEVFKENFVRVPEFFNVLSQVAT